MAQYQEGQRLRGSDGNIYVVRNGVPVLETQSAPSMPVDPAFPYKGTQAQVSIAQDQANTAKVLKDIERNETQDARMWAAKIAEMADKGWMLGPDGKTFVRDPSWVDPADRPKPIPDADKESIRAEAIQKLQLIERLMERSRNGWFTTGFGAGVVSGIDGTAAKDQAADVATLSRKGALNRVMELAKENGGKNPLTPLSGEDFKAIEQSVSNLDPTQSDANFQKNLEVYRDIFLRAYQGAGGQVKDGRPVDAKGLVIPLSPQELKIPGGPGGNGQPMQFAQSERYSTPEDLALARAVQEVYNKGGSVRDMAAAASGVGYQVVPQDITQWSEAVKYRDNPGRKGPLPSVQPRQSGVRNALQENFGNFAASGTGAALTGMADAWTLGGLDEVTGAVNSVFSGRGYDAERDWANMGKQAQREVNGGAYLGGQFAGGLTQGLLGAQALKMLPNAQRILQTTPGMLGAGTAYGSVGGALENNSDRTTGGVVGAAAGLGGSALGRYVLGPAAEAIMRQAGPQAVSEFTRGALRRLPGMENRVAPKAVVPQFGPGERMIPNDLQDIRVNLQDAARLNVPYSLADASPRLRNIGGSAARISPDARVMAENILDPRALGQADRAREGIDRYLAPITDIEARGKELLRAGNVASEPYYKLAAGQEAQLTPELRAILETKSGKDALKRAFDLASDNQRSPTELGFIIDDTGEVLLPGMDGRFTKAQAAAAQGQLTPQTIRTWNGSEVTKNGPIDLVNWLRLNGGLRDQNGELSHMGLSNAMRPGVKLKGQENRFGPIVNNEGGMNFDDAAMRAWEAGYFPELTDRPDVNTFLNAIRDGHDGIGQRFRAEDMGEVERYLAAQEDRINLDRLRAESGSQVWNDTSIDAGPRDFAPLEAYGQKEQPLPTFETLDLIKKGFDARIAKAKDAFGNIDFTGDPELQAVERLRKRFVSGVDRINPDYPKARAEYQKYAKRKEALDSGFKIASPSIPQRDFDRAVGKVVQYDGDFIQVGDRTLPEMQRGYATAMADSVGRARFSANPYASIYGSPNQQERVKALFPQSSDFDRLYGLERDMSKTVQEVLGGSPTAGRQQADAAFMDSAMGQAMDVGMQAAASGGLVSPVSLARLAKATVADRLAMGLTRKAAEQRANNVAGILFNTDPNWAMNYLDDLAVRQAQDALRKQAFQRRGALLGTSAVVPFVAGSNQ